MVRDFAYLIDTYGHVPNGARTLLSQPLAAAVLLRDGRAAIAAGPGRGLRALSAAARARVRVLDGGGRGAQARRRPPARGRDAGWRGAQSLLGRPRHTARRVLPRGRGTGAAQRPAGAAGVPRTARRGRERLGLRLALVRRRAHPRHHRYHRDRPSRSQQPAVRTRERHSQRLRPAQRSGLRTRVCAARRRAGSAIDRYLWNADARAYLDYRWT